MTFDSSQDKEWQKQVEYMAKIYEMEEEQKKDNIINNLQQELERYKNIIDEALGIANERVNYYAHKQIEAEDWSEIFNVLIKRDKQELKGE